MDVIARVTHRRRISGGRVLIDHLFYKSDALATLEAKGMRDVTVAVDELDLGFVYVSHASDSQLLIVADAVKSRYARELTKYEHEAIKKRLVQRTKMDLAELGEYAYEIARWELWQDLHNLKNARSSKRLAALRQQYVDRIERQIGDCQPALEKTAPILPVDSSNLDSMRTGASPCEPDSNEVDSASGKPLAPLFELLDI